MGDDDVHDEDDSEDDDLDDDDTQDLLGIMVWYCSVQNGLKYAETWDTTGREDSMAGFVEAMDYFNNA